jgi:hypothetical protein
LFRKCSSGRPSGENQDRRQHNQHSIDGLSYTHSPPRSCPNRTDRGERDQPHPAG